MTDPDELRRLAAAATRARTAGRTMQDMADAIRFQDVCLSAVPELLDALEAARKDAADRLGYIEGCEKMLEGDGCLAVRIERQRSIIADLRRQLAGLGIPTKETT